MEECVAMHCMTILICPTSDNLQSTIQFLTETLKFKLMSISPADGPKKAHVIGFGMNFSVEVSNERNHDFGVGGPIKLIRGDAKLLSHIPSNSTLFAPNGTCVQFVDAIQTKIPQNVQNLSISRSDDLTASGEWNTGRAGMKYRDLLPSRQGGRYICSHINIPTGGLVPDYVHFHKIRFQMIYCYKGWVKVVYEDQGDSFILAEGDCVLQPPEIRHRVLECSDGLEVIEIGCPAEHDTFAEHIITLPTSEVNTSRIFHGQKFVRFGM